MRREQCLHPWGAAPRATPTIFLFEPRMLPAVRRPVTTFVTIPSGAISIMLE